MAVKLIAADGPPTGNLIVYLVIGGRVYGYCDGEGRDVPARLEAP